MGIFAIAGVVIDDFNPSMEALILESVMPGLELAVDGLVGNELAGVKAAGEEGVIDFAAPKEEVPIPPLPPVEAFRGFCGGLIVLS